MIHSQNTKFVNVLDPVSLSAAPVAMDNSIDTAGYDYCTIIFSMGSINGAFSELHLEQADDNSTFVTTGVAGFDFSGGIESDGTTAALPAGTDDDKMMVFEVDLRGLKRYLRVEATSAGSANLTSCVAILSRASETSNVPADRGCLGIITG